MTTFAQLSTRLKNFLRGWLLVLGLKEGLVECATVCVKSVVILDNSVAGILWACSTCNGVSLCTAHYMGDKHDLSHPFLRFDTPTSPALMLLPRKGSRKQQIKGVFPGAKVQRSADWMWQGKLPHLLLIKL